MKKEMNRKQEDLLLSKLLQYTATNMYPCHMPGHKRMTEQAMLREFPNPFAIDITEIDGFDNLHHAEGILKDSMEWAAGVYGADKTYYLVNGSSGGILSAICAATRPGGKILVSRNCHKSVYHGIILNRLDCCYVYPQTIEKLGIQGGIKPEDVEHILHEQPDIEAVLIVSPTYDGIVSDIEGIARAAHRHGKPLIVDEAHGAHFPFAVGNAGGAEFPLSALQLGADLVIQSLHKTLPSLTQTAVLHMKYGYVERERLERYLQMFQTSSPSYVFMAGIERCIYEMAEYGAEHMTAFSARLGELRGQLSALRCLRILGQDTAVLNPAAAVGFDPSKIVISCRNCMRTVKDGSRKQLDGAQLSDWLRSQYGLEMEMAGADYVVAILTYMDSEDGLWRFRQALLEIDSQLDCEAAGQQTEELLEWQTPDIRLRMADAVDSAWRELPLADCAGEISGEFIYLYPPGIPIAAPGERITEQIVKQVLAYRRMGLPVQGMADPSAEKLRVVKSGRQGR